VNEAFELRPTAIALWLCASLEACTPICIDSHTCAPFETWDVEDFIFQALSRFLPNHCHECTKPITYTTFNNGSLGSRIDEERSEMR
jgi:hypothetical protein